MYVSLICNQHPQKYRFLKLRRQGKLQLKINLKKSFLRSFGFRRIENSNVLNYPSKFWSWEKGCRYSSSFSKIIT